MRETLTTEKGLLTALENTFDLFGKVQAQGPHRLVSEEVGTLISVDESIARARDLPGVKSEELLRFKGGRLGIAYNLDPDEIGIVLLDRNDDLQAGDEVYRTGRVLDVPVGNDLLGRIVDPTGRPIDDLGVVAALERRPIERPAPPIVDRAPVSVPLHTGIKLIDALVPIGRGQRELILGDRQTGKTAIALDAILNQKDQDVICVYCAVGQRNSAVAQVVANLREADALAYSVVVVASGEDPPGRQFIAPYAATTIAEFFMQRGRDVLIVYDDLTRHARAYRELSLLLRRPPGREAYPGDIFYIHSRLLERSTHLREELGGGSLTALPVVETEAQNISAFIPTNLISITDGQVYLSPHLFQKGILPAVDIGKSVSRVGGRAQLAAYRTVAGALRLSYSQFEELEVFSRFATRLDEHTRATLERGRRIRETLKQGQLEPLAVSLQIASLLAVSKGLFDKLPTERIREGEQLVQFVMSEELRGLSERIESGEELSPEDIEDITEAMRSALRSRFGEEACDAHA